MQIVARADRAGVAWAPKPAPTPAGTVLDDATSTAQLSGRLEGVMAIPRRDGFTVYVVSGRKRMTLRRFPREPSWVCEFVDSFAKIRPTGAAGLRVVDDSTGDVFVVEGARLARLELPLSDGTCGDR